MSEQDENRLIKFAQKGNAPAFEELITTRYETMFKYAYTYTRNKQDAEDIAQEAAIKLARSICSFKFKSKFSSWLYVLVMNCAKDFYKKHNRQPEAIEQNLLEAMPQKASQEQDYYVQQVLAFVHTLPEGEKDALFLVMQEGLSHKKAAKLLGVKESTVSWRIHEARKKIETYIHKTEQEG